MLFRVVLLTTATPKGAARRAAFESQLAGEPHLTFYGETSSTATDCKDIANLVFKVHYNAMLSLARDPPATHVLLCEDDCLFFGGRLPVDRIDEIVRTMQRCRYIVCGVGVLGVSWLIPTLVDQRLYHASANVLSHCQLIDIMALRSYVDSTAPSAWRTPAFVESWQAIPFARRVVHWPTLAYQSATPKDLNDITRRFTRATVSSAQFALLSDFVTMAVGVFVPCCAVVAVVCVLVLITRHWPRRRRTTAD